MLSSRARAVSSIARQARIAGKCDKPARPGQHRLEPARPGTCPARSITSMTSVCSCPSSGLAGAACAPPPASPVTRSHPAARYTRGNATDKACENSSSEPNERSTSQRTMAMCACIRATRAVSNRVGPLTGSGRCGPRARTARHGTQTSRSRSSAQPAATGRPQAPGGKSSGSGTGATLMRGGAACLPRPIAAAGGTSATAPPLSSGAAPSAGLMTAGPAGRARDPAAWSAWPPIVVISSSGAPSPRDSQPITMARPAIARSSAAGRVAARSPCAIAAASGAVVLSTCHQGPASRSYRATRDCLITKRA